jgi:hypothetical protein
MLEAMLAHSKKINPIFPTYGTAQAGYFGKKSEDEVISATSLASAIGLTLGTPETSVPMAWLEMALNGKKIYYALRAFRHSISWDAIYNCGAMFDIEGNQGRPTTVVERLQDASIVIDGQKYRVRSMSVPEWAQLIYPLIETWAPTIGSEMNFTATNGAARWMSSVSTSQNNRAWRGWQRYNNFGGNPSNTAAYSGGWSPLLEPID